MHERLVRDLWNAFCDSDSLGDVFEEHGIATYRKVKKSDIDNDPFAAERGIVPGGMVYVLTDAGKMVMRAADEADAA